MSDASTPPERRLTVARAVLTHALRTPPRLGPGRLICIDGPAGAGKTTLTDALTTLRPGTIVVHTDDLLFGWGGLVGLPLTLEQLCAPLAAGLPGHFRRYDWHEGRFTESVVVPPRPLLVIEGVGSGTPLLDAWRSTLVWVDAPRPLRLARWLHRDGEVAAGHWRRWMIEEDAVHMRDRTRHRADLSLDGSRG